MNELIISLGDFLKQQREDALISAAYIQSREKKLAFLKKVNYNIGLIERVKKELESDREKITEQDSVLEIIGNIMKEESPKSATAVIREIQFFKGKEAARSASISRAMERWPELF